MQNFCAIVTKIDSSIYKLVEQNMIISVCNHILFEETVSKSNFILTLLYLHIHMLMYTRQKKKRTYKNRSNLRKITSDRPFYIISVQRYFRYCCFTRLLQSGGEIMLKKIGHEQSGGQIVKSQEISVFIMLSCWISASNWNHLSRPNCIQTLILCKFHL